MLLLVGVLSMTPRFLISAGEQAYQGNARGIEGQIKIAYSGYRKSCSCYESVFGSGAWEKHQFNTSVTAPLIQIVGLFIGSKTAPLLSIFLALGALVESAHAQQPFFNDDADVAEYHRWHFESNDELDVLPRSSLPSIRQNTVTVKFSFGILRNCEIGMDFPLIAIINHSDTKPRSAVGIGDTDYSIKYNFHKEHADSKWPALTASLKLEPPTGNTRLRLGSGLMDYYLNGIVQKTLAEKNVLRINGGATFAGNTLTGVIGIKTRGTIWTGGASFVRQFTKKLDLGTEVYGGYTANLTLGRGELQEQIGGNYEFHHRTTFDFGIIAGQATGSPRYGF